MLYSTKHYYHSAEATCRSTSFEKLLCVVVPSRCVKRLLKGGGGALAAEPFTRALLLSLTSLAHVHCPAPWLAPQQLLSLSEQDVLGMCKQDLDARYVYRMLLRLKGEPERVKVPPAVVVKEVGGVSARNPGCQRSHKNSARITTCPPSQRSTESETKAELSRVFSYVACKSNLRPTRVVTAAPAPVNNPCVAKSEQESLVSASY